MFRPPPSSTLFPYTSSSDLRLVHARLLLDVGVGARDVGLGLVVIVVADEIFDRVVGEEALELAVELGGQDLVRRDQDRKSTRLNSSHVEISYAVFCLKKKNT